MTLLPCPFCGHTGPVPDKKMRDGYADYPDDPDAFAHFIRCVGCATEGPWHKSAGSAVRAWNMRAPSVSATPPALCTHPVIDHDGVCRLCFEKVALGVDVAFAERVAELERSATSQTQSAAAGKESAAPKSIPTCPTCAGAKRWFDELVLEMTDCPACAISAGKP